MKLDQAMWFNVMSIARISIIARSVAAESLISVPLEQAHDAGHNKCCTAKNSATKHFKINSRSFSNKS